MKRAFTLIELIFVIAVFGIFAMIFFPVFQHPHNNAKRSICQSNLKHIGLGFQQYLQDYDQNYPRVATIGTASGWIDELQPYIKSTQIYQCPTDQNTVQSTNPRAAGYTSYWYNARLSGLNQEKLAASALTIINGDGNDGTDLTDARYSISGFSTKWRNDKSSPLYRHLDGCNYGFTDGHVKWYKPTKIQNNASVKKGLPTFSWK